MKTQSVVVTVNSDKECVICYDRYEVAKFQPLPCGHADFCLTCICTAAETHVLNNIKDVPFACPTCREALPTENTVALLSPELAQKYKQWHICGSKHGREKSCLSSVVRFFNRIHRALDYNQLKSEVLSYVWKLTHTRPCPSCNTRVQKNGGCRHMTCRCKFQYCWSCGIDWRRHSGCNPYHMVTRVLGVFAIPVVLFSVLTAVSVSKTLLSSVWALSWVQTVICAVWSGLKVLYFAVAPPLVRAFEQTSVFWQRTGQGAVECAFLSFHYLHLWLGLTHQAAAVSTAVTVVARPVFYFWSSVGVGFAQFTVLTWLSALYWSLFFVVSRKQYSYARQFNTEFAWKFALLCVSLNTAWAVCNYVAPILWPLFSYVPWAKFWSSFCALTTCLDFVWVPVLSFLWSALCWVVYLPVWLVRSAIGAVIGAVTALVGFLPSPHHFVKTAVHTTSHLLRP